MEGNTVQAKLTRFWILFFVMALGFGWLGRPGAATAGAAAFSSTTAAKDSGTSSATLSPPWRNGRGT